MDLANHIAEEIGYELKFEPYPWTRINQYLKTGKIDMVLLYLETEERKKYVHYSSIPYIKESYRFYSKPDAAPLFKGELNNIKDKRIGVVRGYSYGPEFDEFESKGKYQAGSETQLLEMLLRDRVDLILGNEAVITYHANKLNIGNQIQPIEPVLIQKPAFFAFSKNAAQSRIVATEFSKQLKQFVQTSDYQNLLIKHNLKISDVEKGSNIRTTYVEQNTRH